MSGVSSKTFLFEAWQVLGQLPFPEYEWQIVRHSATEFTIMISRNSVHVADATDSSVARAICEAVLQAREAE